MLRKLTLTIMLLVMSLGVKATHMSGGEIYWECIGPNQYRIIMVIYRDCFGINVDPSYTLQVQSPCGNTTMTVSTPGGVEISQLCDIELPNSTCNGGSLPGIQQYIYTGTITLPPCNFYTISYTNIYRNAAIVNLTNPGAQRTYIRATINTAAAPCNDSPQFTNTAIPYVCLGYPITYSFGAYDPESDSLSYELISAMGIAGAPLNYVNPHTPAQPIPGLTLDPSTGEVNFTLTQQGHWVVVVRVNHWVNGQVTGTIMRDMQFVAYPCDNIPPDPATGLVTNLDGAATQTGPRAIQVCESGSFCFDVSISDPNVSNILTAFSNVQQNMPGATFTFTEGNPLTGTICWTATPGTAGFFPFIINVSDGACPIPAFQTYIYSVRVLTGLYGDLSIVDESCPGSADGSMTVNVTAGTGPYSYAWSNGSTGPTLTNVVGEHSVLVTDGNGCVSHPITGVVGEAPPPEAIPGSDLVGCYGEQVALGGTVTNAPGGVWSGGSGTFSGSWPNVQYSPSYLDMVAGGTYLLLTTQPNGNCPVVVDSLFLQVSNSFISALADATDVSCTGNADGTVFFTPEDPSFTYLWNTPGQHATPVVTGLPEGDYEVTVTDALGCSVTLGTGIGAPEPLVITSVTALPEGCLGDGNGSATVQAQGGNQPLSYSWSNGATTPTISVGAGTWTVTVTDANNCPAVSANVLVEAQGLPNVAHAGPDVVGCIADLPVTLAGTVENATGGAWSGGSGAFTGTWPNVQYMPSAADVQAGQVQLTLTTMGNGICPPATDVMTILLPNSFANGGLTGTDALCQGSADGTATYAPIAAGMSFLWNDPAGQTTATANGLTAGTWSITVTDTYGCDTTLSVTIGQPEALTLADLAVTNETCAGDGNGTVSASVSGGTAPYTYAWDNGSTSASITVGTGTYGLVVTDANGCSTAQATATVEAQGQPNTADAGPDLIGCLNSLPVTLNGVVTNAPGGSWSGGSGIIIGSGTTVQYQPTVAEIMSGSVTLTLTTVGNTACPPASDQVTIALSNSFLNGNLATTGASCNGVADGSIVFSPDLAGNNYLWNDPQGQTTATATGLPAGTWSVTITDALGCDTTLTASVAQPDELVVAQVNTTDATCNGMANGSTAVVLAGGTAPYTITWSNSSSGAVQNGLVAGTYSASIVDAQGCTTTAVATINEPPAITLTAQVPDTVCVNSPVMLAANAAGGTGDLTVNWAGLGTGSSIEVAFSASQNVVVTVVDQAGCTGPMLTLPVTVLNLNSASLSTYGAATVCPGGTATVGASLQGYTAAHTMVWPQLGAFGNGPFTVPVIADIDLQVVVSDVCNNTLTAVVPLRLDVPPNVQLPPIIAEGCAPLAVQMPLVATGAGLSFNWDLGNGSSSAAAAPTVNYGAGTYTVQLTVTTAMGCTASGNTSGLIIVHAPPTAAFTATPWSTDVANGQISFTNLSTGSITSQEWTFGDGGTAFTTNPVHTYTDVGTFMVELFVEDANGCTATVEHPVVITPVHDVTVPNAFTPNPNGGNGGAWVPGDLSNDVFYAFVEHVDQFRMRIYNRWGELIFESDDVRRGWDGSYRGQLSPQDVYVVQTWVRFVDGKEVQKLSDLTLFR